MSDFVGEGRIVIRPDTSGFAAELQAQLRAVTAKPIVVPVVAAVAGSIGAAAAGTAALASAQRDASVAALGLASQESVLNAARARGILILEAATVATAQKAGADAASAAAAKAAAAAQAAYDRSLRGVLSGIRATALQLLGLRGAALATEGPFLAGAAAVIALGASLKVFADFESNLNVFQVTAGATADQMERVSATAKDLGADLTLPGVSAGDAAQALTELSKAGLSVQDSLDAARGTLQLATAASIDNATATELVANALNAFHLAGAEATRVADLLAGAANESQGSIADMGIALRQVAPVAALVNFSIEDTVTILTQLARSGLSASDAGTSFRQALLRLIQNMPKVNAEVARLGLNLRDAQGFIRPEVFGELQQRLEELTPAAREAAIATLGGADAIRTFGILAKAGTEDFRETKGAVTEVGLAQKLASARTKGLKGDMEGLKNQIAALGLAFGNMASGPIKVLIQGMSETAAAVNLVADGADELGSHLGFLGGTLGVVGDIAKRLAFPAPLNAIKGVKALTGAFKDQIDTAEEVRKKVNEILKEFEKFGGSQSVAGITIAAAKLALLEKQLESGPEAGQKFLGSVREIRSEVENRPLRLGFEFEEIKIPPNLGGDAAKEVSTQFGLGMSKFLPTLAGGEVMFGFGVEAGEQYAAGMTSILPGLLANVQAIIDAAFSKVLTAGRLAIGRFESEVTDVEFKGGSDQQVRAVLVKQLDAQEKLVAGLIAAKRKRATIDAAKQAAIDTRNRIEAIDDASAAAAESAAAKALSDAKARAQALQKAKDDADKAILDTFSLSRSQAQNRIASAESTARLSDDIRRQQEFLTLVQSEIKVINKRVQDEGVKKAAIAALTAIVTSTKATLAKLVQAQKDAAAARRDALTDVLGKRLQLAELRGDKDAILAALNAAIKDAIKRKNAAKTLAEKLDEQIKLQELINQKNEILAEKAQKGNDAAKFFFEQLQAQQGFAANLLGNLIPSGKTGGLVGVPSPAGTGGGGFGPLDPAIATAISSQASLSEGKSKTGPTAGQASTTNEILRRILHVLTVLNRGAESPEANFQAWRGGSAMSGGGGNTEVM